MRRLLVIGLSLCLSLSGLASVTLAQDKETKDGGTNPGHVSLTSTGNGSPIASDNGDTIVYGDINTGQGRHVIEEPTVDQNGAPAPADVAPAPAPASDEAPSGGSPDVTGTDGGGAPATVDNGNAHLSATDGTASTLGPGNASADPGTVDSSLLDADGTYTDADAPPADISIADGGEAAPEPAPVTDAATDTSSDTAAPADTSSTETAVASETDRDADNEPDALEPDLGLDPTTADTDGDGVADGDELTIYGTEPTVFDTDGDGVSDGEELFGIQTDPLVWDDFSAENGAADETAAQQMAAAPSPASTEGEIALAQETSENMTATDGNATTRGPGSASAAPGRVTRNSGTALLGPDGTYHVSDTAPPEVSVSGDTGVLSPAPDAAATTTPTCDDYASWYDAQLAYEAAGRTDADPSLVSSLDPDSDGIACEDGM